MFIKIMLGAILAITLAPCTTIAQSENSTRPSGLSGRIAINPGLTLMIPLGDLGDIASAGLGINGELQYHPTDNVACFGHLGINPYFAGERYKFRQIAVVAGAKYYALETIYIGGSAGVLINRLEELYYGLIFKQNQFMLGLHGGLEIPLRGLFLDLQGSFILAGDYTSLGLRLGLVVPVGNLTQ